MKKVVLLVFLSLSLTSCSVLNILLGINPKTCNDKGLCLTSFSPYYEFAIWDCTGDPVSQTVEVTVSIKHPLRNQEVNFFYKGGAYDENGNSFSIKEIKFPNSHTERMFGHRESFYSPSGVMLKGKIVLRNVLPSVKKLKLLEGYVKCYYEDGGSGQEPIKGYYKIKNLDINWKK